MIINKKLVEITPEWVLDNLSDSMYADGYGNMSVYTSSVSDYNWMRLALRTLKITFEESDNDDYEDRLLSFGFRIEAIKDECPSLYERMFKLNINILEFKLNRGIGLN